MEAVSYSQQEVAQKSKYRWTLNANTSRLKWQ